jgi:hypothetical protein
MFGINPAFLLFEFTVYILFVLCFANAWSRGGGFVAELIGGLVFGILLEYINANYLADYHYGQFLVMLKNIPLCIGTGWAVIIYSSMALSDKTGIKSRTRPFIDALLALNIDLSMDIIAIRIGSGMWVWGWANEQARWTSEWFGVPFGNFFGWFFVVLFYSGMLRIGRKAFVFYKLKSVWKILIPLASAIMSQIMLAVLTIIFFYIWKAGFPPGFIVILPIVSFIAVYSLKEELDIRDKPAGLIIHAYFFSRVAFLIRYNSVEPLDHDHINNDVVGRMCFSDKDHET